MGAKFRRLAGWVLEAPVAKHVIRQVSRPETLPSVGDLMESLQ